MLRMSKIVKEEASRSKPQLVCNYCGADFTGMSPEETEKHLNTHKYTVAERRVLLPSDKDIEELLREVINGNNLENLCDTPDFILAQYMARCLKALEDAVNARDSFYGIHPEPGMHSKVEEASEGHQRMRQVAADITKDFIKKANEKIEEELTRTPGQVFGRPFIEGTLKDALNFEDVRKAVGDLTITTTVSNCARCGETHEHLNFRKLSGEPIGEYTHWAMCPKTGEPIALLITMQMGKEGYDPK